MREIVFAGSGGQGVLTSGLILGEDFLRPQYWAAIVLVSLGVVAAREKKKA